MKKVFTNRGFEDFATVPADRYGNKVVVRESSLASEACVWIFCNPGKSWQERMDSDKARGVEVTQPSPHLTVEQAKLVRNALNRFIKSNS
jgi:hypothetical protein